LTTFRGARPGGMARTSGLIFVQIGIPVIGLTR
jgi:hypothetical protein